MEGFVVAESRKGSLRCSDEEGVYLGAVRDVRVVKSHMGGNNQWDLSPSRVASRPVT